MRRVWAISLAVLIVTQALSAAVPMLHTPAPAKPAHHHGAHDCCPKPVVQVRNCCPKTVACPHQNHSAGACCCAESNPSSVPTRKAAPIPDAGAVEFVINPNTGRADEVIHGTRGAPLDNSPPVLVLRN
jgi:hypothetical protein